MSRIAPKQARILDLLLSQTLIHQGKKYHYEMHDALAWADQVESGSYLNVPLPKLAWTLAGHAEPLEDCALVSTLDEKYMNAITYEGLRSQAKDILDSR